VAGRSTKSLEVICHMRIPRHLYLAIAGASVPLSALADGGPDELVGRLAFLYFIILGVLCLPVCLFWPGHTREHRVALGIGAPAAGMIAGFAAFSVPAPDDVQVLRFVVASIIPVLAAIVYVLAQRAKANYAGRK
jgi:hypothetical protein